MHYRQNPTRALLFAIAATAFAASRGAAQSAVNQTPFVTPLAATSDLPFRIAIRPYDMAAAEMPTLHSFAAAKYDGKWVLLAGRTNGLHGFEATAANNFPASFQNRDVWVIDPATKQSWHRSLNDAASGLSADLVASLTPTNQQYEQVGDRLYVVGGYGARAVSGFATFSTLSAIDLPGIVAWTKGGPGGAAAHIRQMSDPSLTVTGGAMYDVGGKMQLVFGHNFQGGYTPGKNGVYTQQVRSFEIVDDGVTLSLANAAASAPQADYRRRDLNVFPVVKNDGLGGVTESVVALSGVFTPNTGVWTVPVEIDAAGAPTMDDPASAATFKQGFNGYHSAKLGLFSPATGAMHEVLFGGISYQYRDETTGAILADDGFPFVNDVTAVTIDATGDYSQRHLGYFPEILDQTGARLRLGANAEFFAAPGLATFAGGVLNLDQLTDGMKLGYIFGGIASNSPHSSLPGAMTGASNRVFEVVLLRVPEPTTAALLTIVVAMGAFIRCKRSI